MGHVASVFMISKTMITYLIRCCPLAQEVWDRDPGFRLGDHQNQPFRDWLSGHMLSLVAQEGLTGSLIPKFIGTLWAIWRSRNPQLLNNVCATLDEFQVFYDLGLQEHALFAVRAEAISPPVVSAGAPPGFHVASFRHFDQSSLDVLIRCDGAWDKDTHLADVAWVVDI